MAFPTDAQLSQATGLIVAMFNAAPGKEVLGDVAGALAGGASLQSVANILATKAEFAQVYPSVQTVAAFADAVVANLLPAGTSDAAVTWTKNWITTELAKPGATRQKILVDAATALSVTTDPAFAAAKAQFLNRVDVAKYYSVTKLQPTTTLADLQGVIDGVTNDAGTVAAAKADIDSGSAAGVTASLTTGLDDLQGSSANDTFRAIIRWDTADNGTANLGDAIDGGAGTDTVAITVLANNGGTGPVSLQLANVENVTIADFTGTDYVSAALWEGVEKVTLNARNGWAGVEDLQNGVVMGIAGNGTDSNANFNYAADAFGSDEATLQYEFSNAGQNDSNLADVNANLSGNDAAAAVEIAVTGENFVELYIDNQAANGIETITVTGSGSLFLQANGSEDNNVVTFDASANTGGVEIDLSDSNATLTTLLGSEGDDNFIVTGTDVDAKIDLGAGNDRLIASGLNNVASVDGGEGTDTITLDALSVGNAAKFSNFEIADLAGAAGTIDVGLFTKNTFSSLAVTADVGGAVTLQNLAGTAINLDVGASTTAAITASLKDSSGTADTAAINFDADSTGYTVNALNVTGVETITINSDGDESGVNTVTDLQVKSDTVTKITIEGANDFTLTDVDTNTSATATAATTTVTKLATIDGSAATGDLNITAGGDDVNGNVTSSYKGLTIKTGSGDDTISNLASSGVVDAGAGADTINVTVKGQSVNVGSDEDVDTVIVAATVGGATATSSGLTISNLAADDVVDLSAFSAAAAAIIDYTATALTFNSLTDALAGAFTAAANDTITSFEWVDGNTYVLVDGAVNDAVVKLVGHDYDLTAAAGVITVG